MASSRYAPTEGQGTPHRGSNKVVPFDAASPPGAFVASAAVPTSPTEGRRTMAPARTATRSGDLSPEAGVVGSPSEYQGMSTYGKDVNQEAKLIERSLMNGTEKFKSVEDANRLAPQSHFRARLWQLMDEPSSSRWAQLIAVMVIFTIVVSTSAFIIETLPPLHRRDTEVWTAIEAVCIGLFTVEFVLRLSSTPNLVEFCKSFLNIVDFVAIVPFYIELLVESDSASSSAVFRVIRLVRVFRVFKISRYLSWVRLFASAMLLSAWPLAMLVFVMAIGTIVFSSLIFYMERGEFDDFTEMYIRDDNTRSPYQSIPASFWWCIVTMTTVGYGDDVPVTAAGRVIAAITSLLGILVLAIPITVISANFSSEYTKLKKQKEVMRARMMLLKSLNDSKRSGLEAMFDEIDELVRRNAADFRKEVDDTFDRSRAELVDELKEVTRMAYEQRRRQFGNVLPRGGSSRATMTTAADVSVTRESSGMGVASGGVTAAAPRTPIDDARPHVRSAPVTTTPLSSKVSPVTSHSKLNPHRRAEVGQGGE